MFRPGGEKIHLGSYIKARDLGEPGENERDFQGFQAQRVLYIKRGRRRGLRQFTYDFRGMLQQRGLYIKTAFLFAVSPPLGIPVLPDIVGMLLAVALQVAGMVIAPFLQPGIVVTAVLGIGFSPPCICLVLPVLSAGGTAACLLAITHLAVRDERGATDTTGFPSHTEPPN
jgi:hypothetical protein